MKTTCPWCSNPLVLDDAKLPARPFLTRCPKCLGNMQLPAKGPSQALASRQGSPPAALSQPGNASASKPGSAQTSSQTSSPSSNPLMTAVGKPQWREGSPRALVALDDSNLATAIASMLYQQGYAVDATGEWPEKMRALHQGDYAVVVTAPAGPVLPEGMTLHKRMNHLSPEARRGTFLILIGDGFRTGDGTQAFVTAADLVAHPGSAGEIPLLLSSRMDERSRIYRAFTDAKKERRRMA